MKILYTANATATGGRIGRTTTDDGRLDLNLQPPEALGGPGDQDATNPEQLFAAGYASCFHGAVQAVAQRMELDASGSEVTAAVGFGSLGKGRFGLEVDLTTKLPNLDREQAQQLVEKAHEVCPYSNATRDNIPVRVHVA